MPLKYAECTRVAGCPPQSATPSDVRAFRLVNSPIQCPRDFLPVAVLTPSRQFTGRRRCTSWALSFFESVETAETLFRAYQRTNPQFHKTVGTHIAAGNLQRQDGLITPPDGTGHFSLFENAETDFTDRFEIVHQLVEQVT